MSVEPGVLDANILVYAMDAGAAQHAASHGLLEAARNPATVLYLTSQILCEFYSIVTNPRRIAAPYSPPEALEAISALLALPGIRVLPTPARAVMGWMALLQRHPVTGGDVFDLQRMVSSSSELSFFPLIGIDPEKTFANSKLCAEEPGTMAGPDSPPFTAPSAVRRSSPFCG